MVLIDMDRLRKELMAKGDIPIHEVFNTIWDQPIVNVSQQKWIPCSERLPEKYGNYLVTIEANDGTASIKVQMVDHYGPKWLHDEKTKKVIAWMPLPERYKGGEEE